MRSEIDEELQNLLNALMSRRNQYPTAFDSPDAITASQADLAKILSLVGSVPVHPLSRSLQ